MPTDQPGRRSDGCAQCNSAFAERLDQERYYIGDAHTALRLRSQFNVIDTRTGWKVDLIIRKDRPFSREEFARREAVEILGVTTHVASPEDTTLAKLEWAQASGPERPQKDVVAILSVRSPELDDEYLNAWADELGVSAESATARSLAQNPQS